MTPPIVAGARRRAPSVPRRGVARGHGWLRGGSAVVAGLACFAAFPPVGAWYAVVPAVAALVLAVRGTRPAAAFGLGTLFGAALFVPLLVWIRPLGPDVWLILAVAEALLVGLLGTALTLVQRLPAWPLWAACAWVADEAVRGRVPLGGFPWGRLGFAGADAPAARYAALGGVPVVSFALALAGVLVAAAVVALGRRSGRVAVAGVFAAAVAVAAGLAVPLPTAGQTRGGPSAATVAVVQGNVPRLGLDAFAQRNAVVSNHVLATERFAADVRAGRRPRPDVVLWPENSTDIDPTRDQFVGSLIAEAVQSVGVPTLVGAVLDGPGRGHVRNAGLVWPPDGTPSVGYVKRHLVPFGEYVPYRRELGSVISRLRRVPYDFVPGTKSSAVQLGPVRLADVICYEVAYDGLVRDAVRAGGRLLVVQTNNATYGRTESEQQLQMERLRAIEHGRAVAVAATSGISALITPDGRVASRSAVFTQAVLEGTVPLRDSRTVADRVGAWPEAAVSLAGVAAAAAGIAAGRRRRDRR